MHRHRDAAEEVVRALDLEPHPEGGFYRETFRDARTDARAAARPRPRSTTFSRAGDVSAWHRVDAAEIWHFYAGAPLALTLVADGAATAARASPRPPISRSGERAAVRGAGRLVAERREPRRLDARRLHGRAGLRVRGLRAGAAGWRPARRGAERVSVSDPGLVLGLESRLVNAWPSFDYQLYDGWILRLAKGYSKRANSASPARARSAPSTSDLVDIMVGAVPRRERPPDFPAHLARRRRPSTPS